MPEGPSIVILKELVEEFKGKKIIEVSGNSKLDIGRMEGQTITDFKSWGKHFLICMPHHFTLRVHFMLFGSYRINESRDVKPRLHLGFKDGEINFYTSSLKFIEQDLDKVYDWSADVMSKKWSPAKAKAKLKEKPEMLACDALLDQDIFAGVGNIIKNEVLFRVKVHPLNKIGELPPARLDALIKEASNYSFDFLKWKKKFELKKHYQAYNQKTCPRDHIAFQRGNLGKTRRKTYYCNVCEKIYE